MTTKYRRALLARNAARQAAKDQARNADELRHENERLRLLVHEMGNELMRVQEVMLAECGVGIVDQRILDPVRQSITAEAVVVPAPMPPGFQDIDELVAELEADPQMAAKLDKARADLRARAYDPHGFAVVQESGYIVGAWLDRETAELVARKTPARDGERVVPFRFLAEPKSTL